MKIEIVAVPPGFAPEAIRKRWVGITMDSFGRERGFHRKGLRLGTDNLGGYRVKGSVAMAALQNYDRTAYNWWVENLPDLLDDATQLIFAAEVCREIG